MRILLLVLAACSPPPVPPKQVPAPPPPADAAIAVTVDAAPPPNPGPLDRDLPRLAERSVALYESVVAIFRTVGTDCAAATAKIEALRKEFADVAAANAKLLRDGRGSEMKAALAKHETRLDAAAREIIGSQTISKCSADRSFTRAFDELVAAPP